MSGRSSARPVSFSTMEARIIASSGVCTTMSGSRSSHILARNFFCADLHALDDVLAAVVRLEPIGVGQQAALRRESR